MWHTPSGDRTLAGAEALLVKAAITGVAEQIIEEVFGVSQLQNWRFHPYDDFITYVLSNAPPEFATRLDEWVAKDVTGATPLLLRAQYSHDIGWAGRGHGFADSVSEGRVERY